MEVEGEELQKEKLHGKLWENMENGAIKMGQEQIIIINK